MRSGILARKIGMTRVFTQDGATVPVTMLKYEPCYVTAIRTKELDGYNAVQLATGQRKAKNVTKPMRGHFAKAKVEPQMKICEFRTDELGDVEVGGVLDITHIVAGQYVDARGFSIGKGFAGPMKRYKNNPPPTPTPNQRLLEKAKKEEEIKEKSKKSKEEF